MFNVSFLYRPVYKSIGISLLLLLSGQLLLAQQVKYLNGNNSWNPDSLGNHRAVVSVNRPDKASKVVLNWRRQDNPQGKAIIVVDAKTNRTILNVQTTALSREKGTVYFEPVSGPGKYYIYYMPYSVVANANYPKAIYRKQQQTASGAWLKQVPKAADAQLLYLESVNAMNSFYPMEIIATLQETKQLIAANPNQPYLLFTEDRLHPVRMKHDLPQRWIDKGSHLTYTGDVLRGEYFAWQIAVFPVTAELREVRLMFSDLKDQQGHRIPSSVLSCLNTEGTGWDAGPIKKQVNVKVGDIQPLWCLANIPENIPAGDYRGTVKLSATGLPSAKINVVFRVSTVKAKDHGVNEPKKQTRLTWLNSKIAQENEVIKPYIPLTIEENTLSLLGRKIKLSASGLPEQIQTFFSPEMTEITQQPKNLLAEGMHFHVISGLTHKDIKFNPTGVTFTEKTPGTVRWESVSTSAQLNMNVKATAEFDGACTYTVSLTALQDLDLDNIKFHIPFALDAAKYLMGLGQKGGIRPDTLAWKWDVATKNQDGAWIGDVNAGLQYSLRDQHYVRPLNTNFYLQKPLLLPQSWGNEGKGGIWIGLKGKSVLADNFSGKLTMKKGEVLYYNFTLLITPFHPLDTDFQWANRFYHKYGNLDTIKKTGASLINIHHATPVNPYINYPFIAYRETKNYIDQAHQMGLKVKIYNTIRELSNSAYETFPLRSLGHEVYSPGNGGGYSWLQEHLQDDYIAAWYVPEIRDAAIVNSGMSRWHNYYAEGMNWLVNKVGIDGIYLDDMAFDRVTMKRIKRILTQNGHPGIIDLHSANQYNKSDGFNNSANLYMEHFPYLNRLWFGEYFDYENNGPDFFLTEVSGIPFGLMGEMLQGGGNPWRGMVYGMTCRMPWSDHADPRPLWKEWDNFGMQGTKMIGYWVANTPVRTDQPKVLATIFKKKDKVMVSVASWATADTSFKLVVDWKALDMDPAKVKISAPAITSFQKAGVYGVDDQIPIQKGKGCILIIER